MAERDFLDVMKEALSALAPAAKVMGAEMGAELGRLSTQGATELAQALYNGAAFTPYGRGQNEVTPDLDNINQDVDFAPSPGHQRGGQER